MALEIVGDVLQWVIASGLVLAGILIILIWKKDKTKRITYLRFFIQIASLFAIFSSLLILAEWPSLVIGVIVGATIVFGRFFCGWICPFGLYMDFITLLRKGFKIRYWNLSERTNRALHKLRYGLAGFVFLIPLFYGALDANVWRSFLLFQGTFKLLIVYFLGPLEPLVIPWPGAVGFNGYSVSYPYIREIINYSGSPFFISLNVFLFIALTVVSSFMVRRFWCRFCPTAVSIAVLDKIKRVKWASVLHIDKDEEKCTKCGICKRVCPLQVTEVYEQKGGAITTSMCMLCFRCVEMCPYEDTLKVKFGGKTVFKSRDWLKPIESE
jgi:polyferredoxin